MDRGQRSSRGNAPSPPPGAVPTPVRAQSPSARLAARLALALPHCSCGPRPRQGSEVMSPGAFFGPRDPVVVQRVSAGSSQQVDLRGIGDARKGYIRGTGQPSPAMQFSTISLTLANARLSLSLLRMCRKASWVPKVRLQPAVIRMRKAWAIQSCPSFSNALSQLRVRNLPAFLLSACLRAAHAPRRCLLVCALQREGGGASARLPGRLGRGRAPAR